MTIAERLAEIRARVATAAEKAGRDPGAVTILGASKTQPDAAVREAYAAGLTVMGENYVQDLRKRFETVAEPVRWHFIGSLQTNKVKYLAGKVAVIQTVDRVRLAQAIDTAATAAGVTQDVMLEINVGGEASKSGCAPGEAPGLFAACAKLPGVRVTGLMAIPPPAGDTARARGYFRELRQWRDRLFRGHPQGLTGELSMGMSGDFEAAIAEGSTLIRIGTALFGARRPREGK